MISSNSTVVFRTAKLHGFVFYLAIVWYTFYVFGVERPRLLPDMKTNNPSFNIIINYQSPLFSFHFLCKHYKSTLPVENQPTGKSSSLCPTEHPE